MLVGPKARIMIAHPQDEVALTVINRIGLVVVLLEPEEAMRIARDLAYAAGVVDGRRAERRDPSDEQAEKWPFHTDERPDLRIDDK